MEFEDQNFINKFKALSDINRLKIIQMLSYEELCGCEILRKFNITQPTLSHHMKILFDSGLILCRKDGKNIFYTLNKPEIKKFDKFFKKLFLDFNND